MYEIDRKVVVVTGASAGVGRSLARMLGRRGCKVGLISRGSDGLNAARQEVEVNGGEALALVADVADAEALDRAASEVEEKFGPIELWINNAMVSMYAPFWEMSPKEYEHITRVTYLGQVFGTMVALKRMKSRDRGVIVQVGSALACRSIPLQSSYCGAKHAIAGFTESLRCELMHERSNVKVTIAHLPGVNTTQFAWTKNRMPHKPRPTGEIYQPELAAQGILFAAEHPERKKIIIGMPAWKAIIAEKFFAPLLDRYLAHKAWEGAQLPAPRDPNAQDNFWQPLDGNQGGDHGAHGPFDAESSNRSTQLWITEHRGIVFGGLAALGVAGVIAAIESRRNASESSYQ